MKMLLAASASALCLCASPAFAVKNIVADWTFENSYPSIAGSGNQLNGISADIGSGAASAYHADSSTIWSSPSGNGSAHSLSANSWTAWDYYQFQTSTLGTSGVTLSFDQTGDASGPRDFEVSYSLDGTLFTTFGSSYSVPLNGGAPNSPWNPSTGSGAYIFNFDLSSISALNNASTVYFRISAIDQTAIGGGLVSPSGLNSLDNFVIAASPVPEPSMFTLIGVGLAGLMAFRRKAK